MKDIIKIDGLKIALIGDLKYGRTVHSLLLALSRFKVQVTLVSPPSLRIPQHIISKVKDIIKIEETDVISHVLPEADVFYATRIQKERFTDQNEYQSLIGSYSIDSELVSQMKETAIIMHPLPRVDEINPSVDALPQARYFKQAYYGVPLRMALITLLLGGEN